MRKPCPKVAAQFVHALTAKAFHERAKRKLIQVTAPIFNPAQVGDAGSHVRNFYLRNQHWIVAERRENDLIKLVPRTRNSLAEISHSEYALKIRVSGIRGTRNFFTIGQISESARIDPAFRCVVVQEFRRAFV